MEKGPDGDARPVGARGRAGARRGQRAGGARRVRRRAGRDGDAAERVGERDVPRRGRRGGAVGAARAPARVPQRAGHRVGAGVAGRAARAGGGAHTASAARARRAADRDGAREKPLSVTSQVPPLCPLRVPAGLGARVGRRAWSGALRGAGGDNGADARPRADMGQAGVVHAVRVGPGRGVRPGAPVGALARRARCRRGRTRDPRPARADADGAPERVRDGPGAVRARARGHAAGEPDRARRAGCRRSARRRCGRRRAWCGRGHGGDRLRRRGIQLVPVRPRHDGQLLRRRPGGAVAAGRVAVRLPAGRRDRHGGGRGGDLDVRHAAAAAAARLDGHAPGVGRGRRAQRVLLAGQLRSRGTIPVGADAGRFTASPVSGTPRTGSSSRRP
jgi:hypothetical protein